MRPAHLKLAVRRAIRLRTPLMVHGSPGIGKSQIIDQAAQEEGYEHIIDLRLSQLDQVDLRGVPSVDDGITVWNQPEFLPRKPRTLLKLDELNSANPGVMAAAYELILDRRVGNYKLPDDCAIIAAGNLITDHAMVNVMPTALRNRMAHVTLESNLDDWVEWAIKHGNIHPSILAFLRFRPSLLNEFEGRSEEAKAKQRNLRDATAFATQRAWAMLSRFLHDGIEPELEHETCSGIIGDAASAEFVGFLRCYRDLPDMNEILQTPKQAPVPTEPASLYAVTTALAAHMTTANMPKAMLYLKRLPLEFQTLGLRDAAMRDPHLVCTPEFIEWTTTNASLVS